MNVFQILPRLVFLCLLSLWSTSAHSQSHSLGALLQESRSPDSQQQSPSNKSNGWNALLDLIGAGQAQPEFLDPEVAYRIDLQARDSNTLMAQFTIEDGYYLYQNKTRFSSQTEGVKIGNVVLPNGKIKTDEFFGEQVVYYKGLDVELPLLRASGEIDEVAVLVEYQGCAENGICYPPMKKVFNLSLLGISDAQASHISRVDEAPSPGGNAGLAGLPAESEIFWAILLAFAAGLALTFTPCVLPMIPILASIVVGQGGGKAKFHGGLLSIVYVFGTAVTYAAVGAVAGATGDQLQAYFQNPWAIGAVVTVLVLFSLSLFGLYNIELPLGIQTALRVNVGRFRGGAMGSVFALGLISALIVGACVSPILMTVLGLAIERADPVLGAAIMFSMAMGSGVILIAIGFGAAFLLPKSGPWMRNVQYVFGVMLLGVAIYIMGALPAVPVLYLWGILLIVSSIYLGALQSLPAQAGGWRQLFRGFGVIALIWGVLALLGGMANNRDITQPIDLSGIGLFAAAGTGANPSKEQFHSLFTRVSDLATLDIGLAQARANSQPVMLDYYADWCIDCIRMENTTFSDARVRRALRNFVMLQVDVTDPRNADTNAIKKRYGVYGPPAMLFFNSAGEELRELRKYGYMGRDAFMAHIDKLADQPLASTALLSEPRTISLQL